MAPEASASLRVISSWVTGTLAWTCSLTRSAICSTSLILTPLAVREVEAQVIGRHQRAGLRHVGPEDAAQGRVQEMRPGVMLAQTQPARRLDADRHVLALAEAARRELHAVDDEFGPR